MPIVELTAVGAHSGQSRTLPIIGVNFRGEQHDMQAYEAEGDERQRLWELDLSVYPPRAHYAQRAGHRRIPVMVLQPVTAPPA